MGNELVPFDEGRTAVTRKGKQAARVVNDRAAVAHQAAQLQQDSDYELTMKLNQQAYNVLDAAMTRSSLSQQKMRQLAGDDLDLAMTLGHMKGRTDLAVANSIGTFVENHTRRR